MVVDTMEVEMEEEDLISDVGRDVGVAGPSAIAVNRDDSVEGDLLHADDPIPPPSEALLMKRSLPLQPPLFVGGN